ncbi:hypothetical protein CJU89_4781 [Yarrowia sp. B02]|nr:hypothetical protein CJU89_4781 [Yarrowia sp. B02]
MSTTSTTNTPYIVTHGPFQWRINNLESYATEGPLLYGVVSSASANYLVRKTAEMLGSEPVNRAFDFVTIPGPLSDVCVVQQLGQTLFTASEGGHKGVYHLDWNYKRIRKLLVPEAFGDFESLAFYGSALHLFQPGRWLTLVYDLNRFKPKAKTNGVRMASSNGSEEAVCDSDSDEDDPLTISPRSPPKYGRQRARSSFGSFSESLSQSSLSDDISVCEHVSERSGTLACNASLAQTSLALFADPPSCIIGGEHGLFVDLASGAVKALTAGL